RPEPEPAQLPVSRQITALLPTSGNMYVRLVVSEAVRIVPVLLDPSLSIKSPSWDDVPTLTEAPWKMPVPLTVMLPELSSVTCVAARIIVPTGLTVKTSVPLSCTAKRPPFALQVAHCKLNSMLGSVATPGEVTTKFLP